MNLKEYAAQLVKDAGVPDDKAQAFIDVLSNEKVSKTFTDGFLRQEDYSRNMDGLKSEKQKLTQWYEEQLRVATGNEKVVNEANAKLNQYKELYGELDGGNGAGNRTTVDTSQFIDKKAFEEGINRIGQQSIAITKIGMRCSADYMKRFGEVLDPDALEKFALESGLPLNAAYDKFIEPRVNELTNKSFEEKLKKAREEGLTEGRSLAQNPTAPGNPEPNGFLANLTKKDGAATTVRSGFVEAWTGAQK